MLAAEDLLQTGSRRQKQTDKLGKNNVSSPRHRPPPLALPLRVNTP